MALSGTFQKQLGSNYIYTRVEWSATQNVSARTSTITANLYLYSTGGRIQTSNSRAVSLNIGGNTKSGTANFTLAANQKKLLLTHSRTISHNSAGDLSVAISGTANFNGLMGFGAQTASGTATLNNIGEADIVTGIKLNKSTWKTHSHLTYALDRKKSSHSHRIEIRVNGTLLKTIANAPLSGTLPQFTPDEWKRFYKVLNGRTDPSQLTMDVRVYTYNGSTFIGTRSAQTSIIGTEPSKALATNIDMRNIDRLIEFSHDADAPRTLEYFSLEASLRHRSTNLEYGWINSIPGDGLNSSLWYNIQSPYDNSGFNIPAIAALEDRDGFYWKVRTYYRGVQIGSAPETPYFTIGLEGASTVELYPGVISFSDTESVLPYPTLVKGVSRPRITFDWSKVNDKNSISKVYLKIGNLTRQVTNGTGASSYSWGLYQGGTSVTLIVENEYGRETHYSIYVEERTIGQPRGSVVAQREGFSNVVNVTVFGSFDSLGGKNKITSVSLVHRNMTDPVTVSVITSGNTFRISSPKVYSVDIESEGIFDAYVSTTYGEQVFLSGVVPPAKPLFYIGSTESNIGLGKYPSGWNMVDSEYDIYAPNYYAERNIILQERAGELRLGMSTGLSISGASGGAKISNYGGYIDIEPRTSYVQFTTNRNRYYFDKEIVAESTFRSSGVATFNSDVIMSRDLSIDGSAEVYSRLDIGGSAAVEGHFRTDRSLTVGWGASFGDDVTVSGSVSASSYDLPNGVSYIYAGNSPVVRGRESSSIIYLQAGTEVRAVKPLTTASYIPVRASSHPTASSILYKQNVEDLTEEEANRLLDSLHVKTYHLNSDIDSGIYDKIKIGLINEMSPKEVRDEDGIDSYSVASLAIKQIQIQKSIIEDLERRVRELEKLI